MNNNCTSFEEIISSLEKRNWLEKIYLNIYNFIKWEIWERIRPRSIKWFFQRGFRGYSDYDVTAIDDYLCAIVPSMLRKLKEIQHGIPNHEDMEKNGWTEEKALEEWYKIIDKIIRMFELERKLNEYCVLSEDEEKERLEGWMLFQKWFRALWD